MRRALAAFAAVLLAAPAAYAHPQDVAHAHGLADGALHPLTGPDHLLAMVGVGLWAATLGGRAAWLLPVAFVTGMALGVSAPVQLGLAPGVEMTISISVIALGAMLALQTRAPLWFAASAVAVAGAAHGAAHSLDVAAPAWAFAIGALATTALLHAAGIGAGFVLKREARLASRLVGACIASAGVFLAIAAT